MQKADGLRLFQFKFCLWFLLGWRAADEADLAGGENALLGQRHQAQSQGRAPCGRK